MKTTKKTYESPRVLKTVVLEGGVSLLAGSPLVQPGGAGGGAITVKDPLLDDTDDKIVGTRKSDFSFDWH